MKSSILWLALAISVLFNVFFVAGYMQARTQQPDEDAVPTAGSTSTDQPAGRVDEDRLTRMVTSELGLSDEQLEIFLQLRREMQAEADEIQAQIDLLERQIIRELRNAEPDVDKMQQLAEQQGELRRRKRQAEAGRFSKFVELLTTEQREKLSQHMRRGRDHRGRPGPDYLLKKFDADGDGILNEEETAKAQEWQKQRERDWQERRQRMMDRFDLDKDGELNEEEHRAMREWQREQYQNHKHRGGDRNDDNGDGPPLHRRGGGPPRTGNGSNGGPPPTPPGS